MIAKSWSEAKERGEPAYYTGVPCKHRHLSQRWTVNKRCKECARQYDSTYKAKRTPSRNIWERAKYRAKQKDIPFTIEESDIIIPTHCPILGIELVLRRRDDGSHVFDDSPSIDRIVPNLGYVKGNIQVISNRANFIKRDATVAELRLLADYVERLTS